MLDYHRELLADQVRTNAFREAILHTVRPGDVVIDLGCGSGILSFFACQAGAARVYAIDSTRMAGVTSVLARSLGFEDRITVFNKDSREVEIPERATVLISETLGVMGFDEGIAGSVSDARTRLLTPDARILPSRIGVSLVPVELDYDYDRHIAFWSEPHYGLDLSAMRVFASNGIAFAYVRSGAWLAPSRELFALDLGDVTKGRGTTTFVAKRGGSMQGFAAFFTATLADGVTLSNRNARETSWSQAFLPLEMPVPVTQGSHVEVELEMDDGREWRWRGAVDGHPFDQTTLMAMPPEG